MELSELHRGDLAVFFFALRVSSDGLSDFIQSLKFNAIEW